MPTYKCPQCENVGEIGIPKYQPNSTFEPLGKASGKLVIKCLKCGAGFLKLGLFSKKLTVIPPHEWEPMERELYENFSDGRE
jgi:hypothetical protein